MVYTLGSRFGINQILWELPLDVVHQLEHVYLWSEGENTQKKIKFQELESRLETIKLKWKESHGSEV